MAKTKSQETVANGNRPQQHLINSMIQLQELCVARAQHQASHEGRRLETLDASIQSLTDALPEPSRTQFVKLQQKGLLIIVPVANGVCSACGMTLPKSLIQSIRLAETLHHCPNCARILYYPEVALRGQGKRRPRNVPVKTGIARFSAPELMVPSMSAQTMEETLTELIEKLEEEGFIVDGRQVLEEALKREAVASTAVDHGLAFPHVRGVEGGGLTMALGLSPKGIRFDPQSRSLTRAIFFMVIPTAASCFYLKLLAGLNQTFRDKEHRDKLLEASTAEDVWKALNRLTRSSVK